MYLRYERGRRRSAESLDSYYPETNVMGRLATMALLLAGPGRAIAAQDCSAYAIALEAVGAKATNALVVEQTTMGVPGFAFNAHSTFRRGDTVLARVALPGLEAANSARAPVPHCLVDSVGWHTVSDSVLFSFFRPPGTRWVGFRAAFPNAPSFALMSQPVMAGDTMTIYVAIASDALAGRGIIVRLVRDANGRWVKQAEVQLWIS